MNKKIIAIIFQIPLLVIMIASFFASVYLVITKDLRIAFGVPIILGIVIALYFYGRYLERKAKNF